MGAVKLDVCNPTGLEKKVKKTFEAERFASLDGKRIGLVWNHKDYGDKVLDVVEEIFKERYPNVSLSRFQMKECCIKPPEGELQDIAKHIDAVVYTLGD